MRFDVHGPVGAVVRRTAAHPRSETEKAQVWPRLLAIWPSYDDDVQRSGRDLRVFRLEPQA